MAFRWLLVVLLVASCGDDGGGGDGPAVSLSREALEGIWIEQTSDGYQAIEFTLDPVFQNDGYRVYGGNGDADPALLERGRFNKSSEDFIAFVPLNELQQDLVRVETLTTSTMIIVIGNDRHVYERADECPIDPRDGAWMWTSAPDGNGLSGVAVAVGPNGPALAIAGPAETIGATVTFAERLGCYFSNSYPPYELGEGMPRLAFGPDGVPQIAAVNWYSSVLTLARYNASTYAWDLTVVDGDGITTPGIGIGLAVADDGTAWLSHSIVDSLNQGGIGVSHVAADGTITRWAITVATGRGSSRLVLDASGKPHIVYVADGIHVASKSDADTWTSAPVTPLYRGEVTGFAIDTSGAYHVSYAEEYDASLVYYATNATGSWVITPLGAGHGSDVVVTTAGDVYVAFVKDPEAAPYLATNKSGSWESTKIETPGAKGPAAPTSNNRMSIATDAAGHLFVGFGGGWLATNAY